MRPVRGVVPTRLELLDANLRMRGDTLNYLYARVRKPDGSVVYRATTLYQLTFLPVEARNDPDLTGKMWAALRGMYDTEIPFTYTAAGIFTPTHVGLVQLYGGIGEAGTERDAARLSEIHAQAVIGVLANYPQSRLRPPDSRVAEWIFATLSDMQAVLAIVGQPDPRTASRGQGRKQLNYGGQEDNEITSQQNEILFRTLAKLRINYLFTVLAHPVSRKKVANLLTAVAEEAAAWASLVHGSRSVNLSMGFPIIGSFMHGTSATTSGGHGQGQSVQNAWSRGAAQTHGVQQSHTLAHGETRTTSVADSNGTALGRSHTDASSVSHTDSASHTSARGGSAGVTDSVSHSHTDGTSKQWGTSHTDGTSKQWGTSHTDGTSKQWGTSHTVGNAHTDSTSHTTSSSVSNGVTHSSSHAGGTNMGLNTNWSNGGSKSTSKSHTQSTTTNWGATSTTGRSHSVNRGMTLGISSSKSSSKGHTSGHTYGGGGTSGGSAGAQLGILGTNVHVGADSHVSVDYHHTDMNSHGTGHSSGTSASFSAGTGDSSSHSSSISVGVATGGGSTRGSSQGQQWSQGGGFSMGLSSVNTSGTAKSHVTSSGMADTVGHADTRSVADVMSRSHGVSHADTSSYSHGVSHTDTSSYSHGVSHADTAGTSHGVTHTNNWSEANTGGSADTRGRSAADGISILHSHVHTTGASRGISHSEAETHGTTDSSSVSEGMSHAQGRSVSDSTGQAVSHSSSAGWAAGIAPGVGLSRSWMVENDNASILAELYRSIEKLLYQASGEGAYLADALLFLPDGDAAKRAAAAVPQAFHGPNVPQPISTMPVLDRATVQVLRNYTLAFLPPPDDGDGGGPGFAGILGRRYATLLTHDQLAAYASPSAMEEGIANTSQEEVPEFAFYPDMKGPCILGVQFSRETGEFTRTTVRLNRDLFMHTIFVGDTGYGKTVAAMRYVRETTVKFRTKTIVFDFGAGWRDMLNAPGLQTRTRIYQFHPNGAFPLRWNPLQLGHNIPPELQFRALVDVFGAVTNLGEGRQLPTFRDAVRDVYLNAGVLVDDDDLPEHWRSLTPDEEDAVRRAQRRFGMGSGDPAGKRLQDLEMWERQAVAVLRSRSVDMSDVYARVQEEMASIRDPKMKEVVRGILFRLDPFVKGGAARLFRKGSDAVDVSEIVPDDWGLTVVEGGMFMDQAGRAFALAWLAWQIYTLARIRFEDGDDEATWHLVFEEFNKIMSGRTNDEDPGRQRTSEEYENMFRDSRKYNVVLSAMVQTPSGLPEGIRNSFINWFSSRLKGLKDQDTVLAAWAKSPKGLTDERYRRWIGRMPRKPAPYITTMFGYAEDERLEPFVMAAHMLRLPRVTNRDLWRMKARARYGKRKRRHRRPLAVPAGGGRMTTRTRR